MSEEETGLHNKSPDASSEQGSWSVLLLDSSSSTAGGGGSEDAAGDEGACSCTGSYSLIEEDVSNVSWDILSSTEQKDDVSIMSSVTDHVAMSWADVSKMPMLVPPKASKNNDKKTKRTSNLTQLQSSYHTTNSADKKPLKMTALRAHSPPATTTLDFTESFDDAYTEREGVKNGRNGRPASMFGRNKTRHNSKQGQNRRYDRYGGGRRTKGWVLAKQRHWEENRIDIKRMMQEDYYCTSDEEDEDFGDDPNGDHVPGEEEYDQFDISDEASPSCGPTLDEDVGTCTICLEEKPWMEMMKACGSHPSACRDCLRTQYVVSPQEAEDLSSYPLCCFWPGCDRVLRDTQIKKLTNNQDEVDRHYHMEREGKVFRREKQLELERKHRKELELQPVCETLLTRLPAEEILSVFAALEGSECDGIVFCPACGRLIVKDGGCSHMTCVCYKQFLFNEELATSKLLHDLIARKYNKNRVLRQNQ